MIKIIHIKNNFSPKIDREIKEFEWKGAKLYEYLPPIQEITVSLNQVIIEDYDIVPHDNSEIIIAPKQEASGIASLIGGFLYGAFAGGVATAGTMAAISAASWVAATAIVYAGSMLLNGILGSQAPSNVSQGIEESPTYSWSQAATLPRAGATLPVVYGKHQVAGSIIQRRIKYVGDDEYLYMQLALCSGEIEDIYNGDILINNTAFENYEDIEYRFTNGTENQDVMEYFGDVETPNNFSVTLEDLPIIRQTIGNQSEAIRLFVQFPSGIYYSNDNGGLDTKSVEFKVEYKKTSDVDWINFGATEKRFLRTEYLNENCQTGVQSWSVVKADTTSCLRENEGGYYTREGDTFTGTTRAIYDENPATWIFSGAKTSPINREIRIDNLDPSEYDIRITRLTEVSTDPRLVNKSVWNGMGEIIKDDLAYPTIAILGLRVKATGQLSGDVDVMTIVERKNIEVFDELGVSQGIKRLDNPAWIFWDVLTNKVYGYGLDYSRVDFDSISEWADFCDEIVNNGLPSEGEKRATFNGVFDYDGNLWDALVKIGTIGRGSPIIKGTKYSVIVDKVDDMVQLFNMGNIKENTLKISYIGDEDLANEVEIQFVNAEKDYTNDTITVVQPEWFNTTEQAKKTTIQQMGIVSVSQAYRAGRYYLNYNANVKRTAEFEVGIDALDSESGDVIGISHDVPAWGESGRLVSATSTTITIDKEVQLIDNETYSIKVRLNDNTFEEFDILFSGTQTTDTLTIDGTFVQIPQQYDIYSLIEKPNSIKLFRISGITRKTDATRKITAIEYNESVLSDAITIIPSESTSEIDFYPKALNVKIAEHLERRLDGTIIPYIDFSWVSSISSFSSSKFAIYISTDEGKTYQKIAEDIETNSYTISALTLSEGKTYQFKISGKKLGTDYEGLSLIESIPYKYLGKTYPPSDVLDFEIKQNGNFIDFTWTHITDIDKKGYEIRKGVTWDSGKAIAEVISNNKYSIQAEMNGTYEYLIKAIDTSNIYSVNAKSKVITLTNIDETVNAVIDKDEATIWSGSKINFYNLNGILVNFSALQYNEFTAETYNSFTTETYEDILSASYETLAIDTNLVGLTKIRVLEETLSVLSSPRYIDLVGRTYTTYPLDTYDNITAAVSPELYISYSDDDITYTPYDAYFGIIEKEFRYLKIKYVVDYDIKGTRIELSSLKYILDVADVVIEILDFPISATGEDILYSNYNQQFYIQTFTSATVLGGSQSITPDIVKNGLTGLHIDLYDSTDTKVSGTVDLQIKGY